MNSLTLSPAESALQTRLTTLRQRIASLEVDPRITADMRPSLAWQFGFARQQVANLDNQFGTFSPAELVTVERLIGEAEGAVNTAATVIGD
ncbi:MAG: hypothetical protein Q8T09_03985 [Candidatus Melainabacteria bacterium]|nr:hypothetical protein [Candidatus Melainabacteria bacterium]